MALRYSHRKTLTDGATITIDHSEGYDQYKVTLGGNRTLSLTNFNDTDIITLIVVQDATGGRTLTLDGQEIVLNDGINQKTIVSILRDGTDNLVASSAGASVDTSAPTVVSATAINSTTIRVVFSEVVTATNVGWSFKKNGAAHNPSAVSGSGTNTLDFTVGAMINTDTILRSYDSATGDTMDAASNELVSFTDSAVTNSVPSGAAAYNVNADAAAISFADAANDFYFNSAGADQPFSFGGWFKKDVATDVIRFMKSDGTSQTWGFNTGGAGGDQVDITLWTDASNYIYKFILAGGVGNTNWNHIVVTYTGSEVHTGVNLYVNGAVKTLSQAGSGTYTGLRTAGTLRLGYDQKNNLYGRGACDSLFVVNKALSAGEVTEAYNSGNNLDLTTASFASNLKAFWKFDNDLASQVGSHTGTATTPAYTTAKP